MSVPDTAEESRDLAVASIFYLPPNEAAMLLHVSLRGGAEEELEWCELSKINQAMACSELLILCSNHCMMTRSSKRQIVKGCVSLTATVLG